jgi:hypothetical protein
MELVLVVLILVVSTATAIGVFGRTTQQVIPPPHGQWSPEAAVPGPNLELYTRVKELLDAADNDVRFVRAECVHLRAQLQEAAEQRDMLAARLKSADDVLRAWTHPQMSLSRPGEVRYRDNGEH